MVAKSVAILPKISTVPKPPSKFASIQPIRPGMEEVNSWKNSHGLAMELDRSESKGA